MDLYKGKHRNDAKLEEISSVEIILKTCPTDVSSKTQQNCNMAIWPTLEDWIMENYIWEELKQLTQVTTKECWSQIWFWQNPYSLTLLGWEQTGGKKIFLESNSVIDANF